MVSTVEQVRERKRKFLEGLPEEDRKIAEAQLTTPPSDKTPEQRLEEGKEFIRQREKLASQQQISSREASRQLSMQDQIARPSTQKQPVGALVQQLKAQDEQAQINLPTEKPRFLETPQEKSKRLGLEVAQDIQTPSTAFGVEIPELLPENIRLNLRTAGVVGREAITQDIPSTAAAFIDAATSVFSVRKQADVITAEAAFNDAIGQIVKDIELVKMGQKSPVIVQGNLDLARAATNRLERSQKGLGKVNLRYWLGGGAEVEAEIIIFNQRLIDLENELFLARQQRISNAIALAQQQQ